MSTRAEILAQITSLLPDNNTRAISPADLRAVVNNLTNSCNNSTDEGTPTAAAAAAVAGHDASPIAHLNIQRRTLTGNLVLTAADLPQQKILPDADRDVTLPAEGAGQWLFEICHGGGAYVITLKRAGGTVAASLIPSSPVVVAWDGVDFGIC